MSFFSQPSRAYRNFILVYVALALNFLIPTATYIFAPQIAHDQFVALNRMLGGAAYNFNEPGSFFWWALGSANVAALGFMCLFIARDLRRRYVVVAPLTMLKSTAATLWFASYLQHPEYPAFLAAAILDYVTSAAFVYFAWRAYHDICSRNDDDLIPKPASARPRLGTRETRLGNAMLRATTAADAPDISDTFNRIAQVGSAELVFGFRAAIWLLQAISWFTFRRGFDRLEPDEQARVLESAANSRLYVVRQLAEVLRFVGRLRYPVPA